jgi:predicted kinase
MRKNLSRQKCADRNRDLAPFSIMVSTLYLLCGLPGSGKSTRARQIVEHTNAVHVNPDDWIIALGISLVDYEFRFKLQDQLLVHAGHFLRAGVDTVVEFGSWAVEEREAIRQVAVREGATTELDFLDAPLHDLVRRVRDRGGPDAESLIADVLIGSHEKFERPTDQEIALFDRYVGPDDAWEPV